LGAVCCFFPAALGHCLLNEDRPAELGHIDILVNNAGSAPGGTIKFLTEEIWAQSPQLKFMGYVRCLEHVLPIMQKQGRPRRQFDRQ
jgi:NADP-dependent 3-hydroxy acid dehydrogenase YdfG